MSLPPLAAVVREAWAVGRGIALDGIGYGRIHWGNARDVRTTPPSYYAFLAGLVRAQGLRRILEIGTHCGGSARAMRAGMESGAEIVTIDVTTESDAALDGIPGIRKLTGDANAPPIVAEVLGLLGGRPIDLVYIDALHECAPTLTSYGIYASLLRPRFVVLDDITLNPSMQSCWSMIAAAAGAEHAVDAAAVEPAIRPQATRPGFGLVRLPFNAPSPG